MSTRQRPLPASCVYFDRQRYSLGLPRIAVAGSAAQLFALGVDVAADQARHSVPDRTDIDGPVPVGHEPASLLRSAELLLRRPAPIAASPAIDELSDRAASLGSPAIPVNHLIMTTLRRPLLTQRWITVALRTAATLLSAAAT